MQEVTVNGKPGVLLRPAKSKTRTPHKCPIPRGTYGSLKDVGMIIQCSCGKRYKCRKSYEIDDRSVWVRRLLPWPAAVREDGRLNDR